MRNVTDTSADPQLRRSADRRVIAIVLAGVAAACLVTASFSKSWMANPSFSGLVRDRDGNASAAEGRYLRFRGDIRFGPLGFEQCAKPSRFELELNEAPPEGACWSVSTAELNDEIGEAARLDRDRYTSNAFSHAGWIAFGTSLLSAAALLVAAGMAFARIKKDLSLSPASVALLSLLGAMVSGCVFIATKPGPAGMLGVDLGFWAFGAGTVLGILGAQLLAKEIRPPDEDLLADAMDPADFSFGGYPLGRDAAAPAVVPAAASLIPPTQPVDTADLALPAGGAALGGAEVAALAAAGGAALGAAGGAALALDGDAGDADAASGASVDAARAEADAAGDADAASGASAAGDSPDTSHQAE